MRVWVTADRHATFVIAWANMRGQRRGIRAGSRFVCTAWEFAKTMRHDRFCSPYSPELQRELFPGRQTDRQTDRKTERQTDRQADGLTDRDS